MRRPREGRHSKTGGIEGGGGRTPLSVLTPIYRCLNKLDNSDVYDDFRRGLLLLIFPWCLRSAGVGGGDEL